MKDQAIGFKQTIKTALGMQKQFYNRITLRARIHTPGQNCEDLYAWCIFLVPFYIRSFLLYAMMQSLVQMEDAKRFHGYHRVCSFNSDIYLFMSIS